MEVGINHLTSVCEAHGLTSKTLKKVLISDDEGCDYPNIFIYRSP